MTTPDNEGRLEPPAHNAAHILVVDDDHRIRKLLTLYLTKGGYRVTPAADAASARNAMRSLAFDLVILDVMMPGESGMSLARDLKTNSQLPICMLTAKSDAEDRIRGLEAGVDDYLPKPFEPRELLLRIKNLLRRGQSPAVGDEIRMGGLVFQIGRGELKKGEEIVKLTESERDLLRQFAQRPGMPIARHELIRDAATGSDRAIDVQISRLRRKIETDPSNPVYLQTSRGKGYILYID
ncbi:MAG: response regulator [Hyphomicrobiaceae bacterium]